ncbi:MAG: tellurite resistance TerB family protein [Pseudomonadota bacterium]
MFDVDKILTALRTDPEAQKTAKTAGAGVAAGLAASMLMGKKGRKFMGNAAKLGALAAAGGLAYQAWRNREAGDGAAPQTGGDWAPPPAESDYLPSGEGDRDDLARALVRAMIAAAKADGKIDHDERERIFARLNDMDLTADEKAFVFDELNAPLDLDAVAASAKSPAQAAEIYAASLVAIEADTVQETTYLNALAAKLRLDEGLVAEIHAAASADA